MPLMINLPSRCLYIKSGEVSIIDVSVIEAKQCRLHKRADGSSTQDPDAAWNVKAGSDGKYKSTYGYKAHINVDEEGLIKAIAYSAGNVHDSNHFTTLPYLRVMNQRLMRTAPIKAKHTLTDSQIEALKTGSSSAPIVIAI